MRRWAKAASTTVKTAERSTAAGGALRRSRRTSAESTLGTGQNTARPTVAVRRAVAYQATLADGTPYVRLPGGAASLSATSGAGWSPKTMQYDGAAFDQALPLLLAAHPTLRHTDAYRYDLVDVARQTLTNRSRILLP